MRRPVGFVSEQKFRNTLSHMTLQRVADKQRGLQAEMAAGWESVKWCCDAAFWIIDNTERVNHSSSTPGYRRKCIHYCVQALTEIHVYIMKIPILRNSLMIWVWYHSYIQKLKNSQLGYTKQTNRSVFLHLKCSLTNMTYLMCISTKNKVWKEQHLVLQVVMSQTFFAGLVSWLPVFVLSTLYLMKRYETGMRRSVLVVVAVVYEPQG